MSIFKQRLGCLVLFVFFMVSQLSHAQIFELKKEEFGSDMKKMLATHSNSETVQLGVEFEQFWNSSALAEPQKQQIFNIATKMNTKRYRVRPQFHFFVLTLMNAVNKQALPMSEMKNMLVVIDKIFEQTNGKEFGNFLQTLHHFFDVQALYFSNYSKLYYKNGTYSFEFVELVQEVVQQEEDEGGDWFEDWDKPVDEQEWSTIDDEHVANKEGEYTLPDVAQPTILGAVVHFKNVDLEFVTRYDTATLYNTSGSWMISNKLFVGEGGRFDWSSAGLSPEEAYGNLNKYNFSVNRPYLAAEKVMMTYPDRLNEPIEGVFEFESKRHNDKSDNTYPRFKSYANNITVKKIGNENVDYKGGFALVGSKIFGASVVEGPAIITVKEDGETKFKVKSHLFNFEDSLINAQRAAIVMYHGEDSIIHPAIKFKFNTVSNELTLLKDEGGFKGTSYFSSYYNIGIKADMIKWNIESDSLDIAIINAKDDVPAMFESLEFFHETRFRNLGGLYDYHPLLLVVNYARKTKSSQIYVGDVANYYKKNENTLKNAMLLLMQEGLIDYNTQTGLIQIKRKGYHYVLSQQGRKDYDNLIIPSISSKQSNATIHFDKNELTVRGIKKFYISEKLDVYIKPKDNQITLLQNRDFEFDGQLNAGSFEFMGKDFKFDYDSFKVDLPQIDSIAFNIAADESGQSKVKQKLANQLEETAGILLINKPNNKSAKRDYPHYPTFASTKGAMVYYDDAEVLGGAYDRSVYFNIPPFEIDSVSSSDPGAIKFSGTFTSGGIMPDIEQSLQVMPDKSLGFNHQIPDAGFQLYNTSAIGTGDMVLDNGGIQTTGKINYLTTTLTSEKFVYYLDSVTSSNGSLAEIREQVGDVSYAQATVDDFRLHWEPYADSMLISNNDKAISMFNGTATLDGTVIMSAKGMYGLGNLNTRGSKTLSNQYTFKQSSILARNSAFEINSTDPKKPAFSGDDVRLNFNFEQNKADISPEVEGVASLDFPYVQFKTSISNATWSLDEKKITMSKPDNVDISKSYFYSTKKEMDSLVFSGTAAEYDIDKQKLNISGVPYIVVADAKVTPEGNRVRISGASDIQSFNNAVLVMDTVNEFHRLFDGDIKIHSRNKFEGSATYQFVNAMADTFNIKFGEFTFKEDELGERHTVASGIVDEQMQLLISSGMYFKGLVTMRANLEALALDGLVKLDLKNISEYDEWIQYKSESETQAIVFDFDNSVTENGDPLNAGLHFELATNDLYCAFVTEKITPSDPDFFIASGNLSFDEEKKLFRIEDPRKTAGESYAGKSFTYDDESGNITIEGPMEFMSGFPKGFDLQAVGRGKGNLRKNEFTFKNLLSIQYDVPSQAIDEMAKDVQVAVEQSGVPEAHRDKGNLMYKIAEIMGDKATKDYEERSVEEYVPLVTMSSKLVRSLVLSSVNLKWNNDEKAWYSTTRIGISNIDKNDINARVEGFLEIKKTKEGELINIFLQVSPSCWYFISYEDNTLLLYSSNSAYNGIISSKSSLSKAGLGKFAFGPADMDETMQFINRFRQTYLGINEPYNLQTASEAPDDSDYDTFEDDGIQEDEDTPKEKKDKKKKDEDEVPSDEDVIKEEDEEFDDEIEDDDEGF